MEYRNMIHFCEVQWLKTEKMLKQFYDLKSEIFMALKMKGIHTGARAYQWWYGFEFCFLVHLTAYLNELNLMLQEKIGLFIDCSHVKTFQAKLQLWETQLRHCKTFHLVTLSNHITHDNSSSADELCSMNNDFNKTFKEFKSQETNLCPCFEPF